MCSVKTIPILVLVHKSFTLDAVIKVTQLIMEGRQVRNKTEEKKRSSQHVFTNRR